MLPLERLERTRENDCQCCLLKVDNNSNVLCPEMKKRANMLPFYKVLNWQEKDFDIQHLQYFLENYLIHLNSKYK